MNEVKRNETLTPDPVWSWKGGFKLGPSELVPML